MKDDIRTTGLTYVSADPEAVEQAVQWFDVSGDLDDFIYYGEDPRHSER